MSKQGINQVTLVGNLGKDPEIIISGNQKPIARLHLATNESYKKDGNKIIQTEWHKVVLFNGMAQFAQKYLRKGDKVYILGKLKTDRWEDEEGIKRVATKIVATELQSLSAKRNKKANSTQNVENAQADSCLAEDENGEMV